MKSTTVGRLSDPRHAASLSWEASASWPVGVTPGAWHPPALPVWCDRDMAGRETEHVERDLALVLGAWGLSSTAVGTAVYFSSGNPALRAFGGQNAAWGAIDLAIATLARIRAGSGNQPQPAERRKSLRRVLAANTVLDVGYIIAGSALLRSADVAAARRPMYGHRSAEQLRGDASAIVVQGGFLLLLDAISLARLRGSEPVPLR